MSTAVTTQPPARFMHLFCVVVAIFLASNSQVRAAEGIRSVDLAVKALVFDPFTQRLYGSATNDLLQIDPVSGAVLKVFPLGTNVTLLSLGAGNGIWVALEGEHAVRRFNLETLTAEEPIPLVTAPIRDLYASKEDSSTVAILTRTVLGMYARITVVRNGVDLPDFQNLDGADSVGLRGNVAYGGRGEQLFRFTVAPSGIIPNAYTLYQNAGYGHFTVLPPYIYRDSGDVLDMDSLAKVTTLPFRGVVAVDEPQTSVYFLHPLSNNSSLLARFAHPSLQFTAAAELPGIVLDGSETMAAYSSSAGPFGKVANRLAISISGKLLLLDTDKLFVPANLAVFQGISGKQVFGAPLTFEVTITNKGPGTAIRVNGTDSFSSGAAYTDLKPGIYYRDPIPLDWTIITPGNAVRFSVTAYPSRVGSLTNTVSVTASNALQSANERVGTVGAQRAPVTSLSFSPTQITFDPKSNRLFFDDNGIWSVDPDALTLNGPSAFPDQSFGGVSALESSSGALYGFRAIQFSRGQFVRIDEETLALSNSFGGSFTLYDFQISPADTNILFISDDRGSALYKNGVPLPSYLTEQTRGQFSADGTHFYALKTSTCELQIYSVSDAGLVLQSTQATGSCSDFKQEGNLLYYDSGMIYDPVAGHKMTNSLTLSAGSSVVPRPDGTVDVVTKKDGVWVAQRLAAGSHEELRRVYLSDVPVVPVKAIAAGANRIALLTAVGGVYLIDFSPDILLGRISRTNENATISFDTTPGKTYQLETAERLEGLWVPVGPKFLASGSIYEVVIKADEPSTSFFRIMQVQLGSAVPEP